MANALDKARQYLEDARGKINEWDRALESNTFYALRSVTYCCLVLSMPVN